MKEDSHLVNASQFILQSYDQGKVTGYVAKRELEKIFPMVSQKNMILLICQCYDKMFYTEEEIEYRWNFDVWEEKRQQFSELDI